LFNLLVVIARGEATSTDYWAKQMFEKSETVVPVGAILELSGRVMNLMVSKPTENCRKTTRFSRVFCERDTKITCADFRRHTVMYGPKISNGQKALNERSANLNHMPEGISC